MANIKRKTGWQPQEWYFNDINAELRSSRRAPYGASSYPGTAHRMARRGALLRGRRAIRDAGHVWRGSELRPLPMTASSNTAGMARVTRLSTNAAYSDNMKYQPPGGTRERPAFLLPKSERSGSVETRVIKLADIKPAPYNPGCSSRPRTGVQGPGREHWETDRWSCPSS